MGISIATAPCCWGVDDIENPNLPPWERVFDEAAAAGYSGLELGPYGYVPLDLKRVSAALAERDLSIVAGTIFNDLVSPSNRQNLLKQTDEICALISRLPPVARFARQRFATPYLTVMDWGHDERDFAAGHSERRAKTFGCSLGGDGRQHQGDRRLGENLRRARRHSSPRRRLHRVRR